jgi:hypothetical protein
VNILDKIAILSVVLWGGYTFYMKIGQLSTVFSGIILLTFLFCVFVFYYGYVSKQYCYHPDKTVGDRYHAILHIIAALGHHMIILSKIE